MYSRIILNSFQNPPGRLQESCSLQPARLRLGIMCLSHNHFHRFLSIRMMYVPGCGTDKRLLWLWYTSHLLRSYRATKSQSAQLRIVSLLRKQDKYFISTKALVPNYEESLINGFLLMGISIKAA